MDNGWYKDFFQGLALDLWRDAIPAEQTEREAEFLAGLFAATPGGEVLDVPCGNGRLALALAERGYRVTGVDFAAPFIAEAQARAQAAGHDITWRQGEMRDLPWREAFDGAFCYGNSFGYFDAAGSADFLAAVAGTLRRGGRFVLETALAAESLLPELEERAWRRVGDMLMLVENRYHAADSRLEAEYTFLRADASETRRACYWVFTVGEIGRMLTRSGLEPVSLFDSTEMEPFRYGSRQLIVVAEKG
jgi:SAM-dependent methyltransferase